MEGSTVVVGSRRQGNHATTVASWGLRLETQATPMPPCPGPAPSNRGCIRPGWFRLNNPPSPHIHAPGSAALATSMLGLSAATR